MGIGRRRCKRLVYANSIFSDEDKLWLGVRLNGMIDRHEMKLRPAAALAAIAILITGCGSQNSSDQNSPNKMTADFGCKISPQNAQQICLVSVNEFKKDPEKYQREARAAQGHETIEVGGGVAMPSGEIASVVQCWVNTTTNAFVYARLLEGPKTQEQADYLKSQGYCSDSN